MSIYDWYKYREEPSAAEQSRQEMNRRLYGIVAGEILDETEEDKKNFSKFFQDLAVYSTFYEKRDPTTFGKAIAEEKAREEEERQREGAVRFIDQLVDLGGGITPRGRELRDELGLAAPIIGIDYETGNIAYTNLDQQQAEDRIAYTAENQLSLFGTEAASIYGVTRKYTGGANIFRSLEQQAPSLFQQPTEEEQEFIKRSLTFQGSWDRTLDILPFVNTRTAGSEDVDTNVWFLENVRSWFDASILPTEALGGKKQEGWDGSKAWGVLQEYHPDFASYLVTVAGVNPDDLAKTPNHWEFRYAVNNAIEMSNIYAVLENARRDRNNWEGALNFAWNFLRQSFRSADMPLELALTAASFGAYGAVGIGTIGLRGTKALSLAKSSYDATQLIRNTERLATATSRTNKILSGARTTQALLVPSNWGQILTSSIFNRKLATEGVRWGSNYNWGSRFMLMAPIDAGQGLVEGFLYGLQNQLTDNLSFSGERLWMETWSEAAGQMVFGKVFRGFNQSVGIVANKAGVGLYGSAVWSAVSKPFDPSLVRMIELQAQLNNPDLSVDQIEQAYLGAFLQLHQHAAWQGMTGDKRGMMPAHVTQFMGVIQSAAKQKGVNIDVVSLAAGVYDSLPVDSDTGEKVKLTEDEAAMLLIGSTLDQLSSRGLTLTDSDWTETNKQAAIYFLMSDKMAEMGISKEEQARMIVENPKEYRKKMKEAYAEILTSDPKIVSQKVEELAEIGRSTVEKAGIPIKIIVDDSKAQAVSIIDAFRDEMGNIDTALLREIFENSRAKELNISPETVRLVLDFARSQEERAAAEEVTEVPEGSGDTVLEGEPTTKPIRKTAPEATPEVAPTDPSPKKLNAFAKLKARVDDARSRNLGPKEVLNRLYDLKRSYRLAIERDNADPSHQAMVDIDNYIQQIETELAQQGYEIDDPIGSLWNDGRQDLTIVAWSSNPEAEGKETKAIIVDVEKPIIRKDGEIIQSGKVIAEERPLSDSEIATKIEQEKSMRQRLEEKTPAVEPEMPVEEAEVTAPEEVRDTPAVEPAETTEVTTTTNLEETITLPDYLDRAKFADDVRNDPEFRDCFKK